MIRITTENPNFTTEHQLVLLYVKSELLGELNFRSHTNMNSVKTSVRYIDFSTPNPLSKVTTSDIQTLLVTVNEEIQKRHEQSERMLEEFIADNTEEYITIFA